MSKYWTNKTKTFPSIFSVDKRKSFDYIFNKKVKRIKLYFTPIILF